jgi:S1-C subfamily serine protease
MGISSSYKLVKSSIVAFVAKYVPVYDEKSGPPPFPPILGTGFVVREDGVLATNAHVVRAFKRIQIPGDAPKDDWPVRALMFKLIDQGMVEIPLEILGVAMIGEFSTGPAYYGPRKGPDLAFVHVKARGLPAVQIDARSVIDEGTEVATAGFPMGTDALMAPGWIHQLTPTLQRGIVSAVLPFPCPTPHAYSVNVMAQGGASGSPVFLSETGAVVGVLYAGLNDYSLTLKNKDLHRVPTNISYVVPSHYLLKSLDGFLQMENMEQPSDAKTIDEMLKDAQFRNILQEGRDWITKKVDPEAEAKRVSELTRLDPRKRDDQGR